MSNHSSTHNSHKHAYLKKVTGKMQQLTTSSSFQHRLYQSASKLFHWFKRHPVYGATTIAIFSHYFNAHSTPKTQIPDSPAQPHTHSVLWGMFFFPFSQQLQTSLARADKIEQQRQNDLKAFEKHVEESIERLEHLADDHTTTSSTAVSTKQRSSIPSS